MSDQSPPSTRSRSRATATNADALTLDEARLIALAAQRLDAVEPRTAPPSKAEILATIRAIGCVQLDTISVVARSHETVLWSRLGVFDRAHLTALQSPDRALIEYWAHAAAIVPVEIFPYFRRAMARSGDPTASSRARWAADNAEVVEKVLTAVRERGSLSSRAFERAAGPRPSPWAWWGGKPERQALDFLWTRGDLMVLRRDGFERVYELTERLLPGVHDRALPTEEEERRAFVTGAVRALGVATPRWVADYFRTGSRPHVPANEAAAELRRLEAERLVSPVTLPGIDEPAWLDRDRERLLQAVRDGRVQPTRTTLLSPFDNLVWQRERALKLFSFDYRLESYTPALRRRYGYYTLPMLHCGRLVGRLDPVYRRKDRVLTIKAIHLEPGEPVTDRLVADLASAIRDYCAFLGGGAVTVVTATPSDLAPALSDALRHG